jgi:predicted dehydrogenase
MRLLILGTGGMANSHAEHFSQIDGVKIVGGVDVNGTQAEAFAARHGISKVFTSLEDAIAWGRFDAVANVTPDRAHHPTTMRLIAAGKHVFCEKPLATDHAAALEMTEAAEKAGLVNMVNLTYRNVAPLQKARELVLSGAIGTARHVEASYKQSWLVSKAWGDWQTEPKWLWRLSKAHGSNGVLGDVGIHILDFAVHGSGQDLASVFCRLKTFDKAEGNRIGEYELDANDSFAMTVGLANGALGVVHASRWTTGHLNDLTLCVYGDRGGLEVKHDLKSSSLRGSLGKDVEKAKWRRIDAGTVPTNYQRFAEAVRTGRNGEPDFRHATSLQRVLDMAIVSDTRGVPVELQPAGRSTRLRETPGPSVRGA